MDDKTMLELAARAAGYDFAWGREWHDKGVPRINDAYWNPIEENGAALKLACDLGMIVRCWDVSVSVDRQGNPWVDIDIDGDDKAAAVRRAITKCAAEIGKGMGVG